MNRTPLSLLLAPLALLACSAQAQDAPMEFPPGAQPLMAEALKAAVADKVFNVQPAKGTPWRLQFNANGYFFVNVGNFSDNGKWSAKDSTLCTEGRQIKAFCNEMRLADGTLYMKRDSGEVVKLVSR